MISPEVPSGSSLSSSSVPAAASLFQPGAGQQQHPVQQLQLQARERRPRREGRGVRIAMVGMFEEATKAYAQEIERHLRAGDSIMSGTPAGVGPIKPGDKLEGHVEGVGDLTVSYAK